MKQAFLFVGLVLCALCATAQKPSMKWGNIDDTDLEMKVYEHDSTAEAVILGDYGEIYFSSNASGLQLNIKRHVRIKVLKSEGSEWANVEIPLYKSRSEEEKILSVKGMVYNVAGGKLQSEKMDKDAKFKEEANERLDLLKFTMPNVKEGSIIEYEYHKQSQFFYELETWVFQEAIPSRWSELRLLVPEYLYYKTFMQGYHAPAINESKRYSAYGSTGTEYLWAMQNLPALKNEAYITTLNDYASKIEFELSTIQIPGEMVKHFSSTWEKLNKGYLDDSRFGGELKKQRQVSKLVEEITAGMVKPEEKLNAIYAHIQQNVKYNGRERDLATQNFKETLTKREGSSADINLLLIAMLREAGFNANPVILSTRSHGRVNPVVPMEKDFNYVLCQLQTESENLLIDATDPLLPAGTIPFRCMNGEGRLVSEFSTVWVPLLNKEKHHNSISAKLKLTKEGVFQGTLSYVRDGYAAQTVRQELVADGEDKYLENKKEAKANWTIQELKFTNQKDPGSRLEEQLNVEIREKATAAGERIYLSLLPEGVEESNPFKLEDRKFPVDFGCPTEKMLMFEIELPEGYEVEALPQPALVYMPGKTAMFRHNVTQMGNKLMVVSSCQIKKPQFLPEEYQQLKQFYQLMLAKQNEQVVLKAKN